MEAKQNVWFKMFPGLISKKVIRNSLFPTLLIIHTTVRFSSYKLRLKNSIDVI